MDLPSIHHQYSPRLDLAGPAPCEDYDRDENASADVGAIGWIVLTAPSLLPFLFHDCCFSSIRLAILGPLSSEYGTYKTVEARFWPWLFWSESLRPFKFSPLRSAAVPGLTNRGIDFFCRGMEHATHFFLCESFFLHASSLLFRSSLSSRGTWNLFYDVVLF